MNIPLSFPLSLGFPLELVRPSKPVMHQVNFNTRNQRQRRKDNRRKMAAGFKKF